MKTNVGSQLNKQQDKSSKDDKVTRQCDDYPSTLCLTLEASSVEISQLEYLNYSSTN